MKPSESNGLGWLNATQFLGALNDNLLKLLIIFALIGIRGGEHAGSIAALVGISFVLPFLLFSAPAGTVADRFGKSRVIRIVKLVEVVVTALAAMAFAWGVPQALYGVIFLMGAHSAFFAPAKYGVIPELVAKPELSRANGLIESATFVAVIVGTALASLLVRLTGSHTWGAAVVSLAIALLGLVMAWRVPQTPAAAPSCRMEYLPTGIGRTLTGILRDRDLSLAVAGLAYFMFVGAFAQLNLIGYGMERLGLDEAASGYLFLVAALGIGTGSLLAARLSGRTVEFGIVPIGALGLTVAPLSLFLAPPSLPVILCVVLLLGVAAGLFSLPLQTFIQFRADPVHRGEILAASSFVNWVAILASAGCTWLFSGPLHLSAAEGFALVGGLTLCLTVISLRVLPDFLLRFLALVAVRLWYRLKIIGVEHVPVEGGALLVPNHVTWADALLLIATNQRRIRFIMDRTIYNTPFLRSLCRLMGVIPVSPGDGKREMLEFIRSARAALDEGYLVCIFAEGALTRTGMLQEFRGGFQRIVKNSDYPIIPVYIGGAWGSILSYAHGQLLSRLPTFSPYPVSVLFGAPLPATSSAVQVRQAVMELSCEWFDSRKGDRKTLAEYFVATARKKWRRRAVADSTGRSLRYGETLVAALALARVLKRGGVSQAPAVKGSGAPTGAVGILLPPSVGGVLANLAVAFGGGVVVNLNYTAPGAVRSAVAQCGLTTIITSRAFLEKLPSLPPLEGLLYLEDLLPAITPWDKLSGLVKGAFSPAALLCSRRAGSTADDVATVIFSSGSTGDPKGVMLSHHNIMSNIEALRMVFRVDLNDNICSPLPFFHSLGFTATIWLPLVSGFSAVYHHNPLEGEKIAHLVRQHRSTLLLATPTFLLAYLRRASREDFASLRLVITGAEKLSSRMAEAFREKFGIRPLEGYGATELSPVITLSVPDVEVGGVRQHGVKEGSVGHPVPGVALRIVDPESGTPLEPGESGAVQVKGPNVMRGYLGKPEETAAVLVNGWYDTGDMGRMDGDGFLHITDRRSRFSKIGGEMVPHGAVEEELHRGLGGAGLVVAVTAVADEKKGEKLMVLYTRGVTDAETLRQLMAASSLPNLWKPGRDCYVEVDQVPLLGTGKLDLKRIRDLAGGAA